VGDLEQGTVRACTEEPAFLSWQVGFARSSQQAPPFSSFEFEPFSCCPLRTHTPSALPFIQMRFETHPGRSVTIPNRLLDTTRMSEQDASVNTCG
jgi:hypothetical protein